MIHVFDSAMPGALQLTGAAGSLKAILKTYLVDGSGAGPVATLTVTAGVATATYSLGHPFKAGVIAQFAGAAPAELNGLQRILSAGANSVTFAAPGVADGVATGSITSKLAPAGWQELFAGALANVLVLKPSVPEATGCLLRVDDSSTATTNISARVRGFESMSAVSAGLGQFPVDAQIGGGGYWLKGANANARPWTLVADERAFYFATPPGLPYTDRYQVAFFGDISSAKSGDAYSCLLTCTQTPDFNTIVPSQSCVGVSSRLGAGRAYMPRGHGATGGAIPAFRVGAGHNGPAADCYSGNAGYSYADAYPNPADNGLLLAPVEVFTDSGRRGALPGLYHARNALRSAAPSGTLLAGTGDLAGRTLMSVTVGTTGDYATNQIGGAIFLDLAGPWRAV